MATVFDAFKEQNYTYFLVFQSSVRGDVVGNERNLTGIFKDKAGSVQNGNIETVDSSATLHVHPEDFYDLNSAVDFIGNGVSVNGQDYEIVGATSGTNFNTGIIEHYRLTLQKAEFIHV